MGFDSYSAYQLDSFSLASHPSAVVAFLERFAAAIQPKCRLELADLQGLKALHLPGDGDSGGGDVRPWDRAFLTAAARSSEDEASQLASLPEFFQLEQVVEGLSQLLRRSMGVQLQEQPLAPGEGWAPGVRKLAAMHETGGWVRSARACVLGAGCPCLRRL
jgi:intermediate peptidase